MILQRLTVVPSDDTLQYLNNVFSTAPFDIDLSDLSVDIMISQDPLVANPRNTYTLVPAHIKLFYDSNLGMTFWVMSFESPDLQKRYDQLIDLGVTPAFEYEFYNPHAVILREAPPLSSNYRRFIISMANVFGDSNKPLLFGSEMTFDTDLQFPPEFDYNQAMDSEKSGKSYMTGF